MSPAKKKAEVEAEPAVVNQPPDAEPLTDHVYEHPLVDAGGLDPEPEPAPPPGPEPFASHVHEHPLIDYPHDAPNADPAPVEEEKAKPARKPRAKKTPARAKAK